MPKTIYETINWKNKTPEEKKAYWAEKTRAYKARRTGRKVLPRRKVDFGELRECAVCKEKKERTSENFYRSKGAKEGFQTTCKPCASNVTTNYYVQEKFGLTLPEYRAIMKDARCDICYATERLVLDHCHEHGHIRAVLCHHCNTGLGHFRDDPDTLTRAIEYLRKHRARA